MKKVMVTMLLCLLLTAGCGDGKLTPEQITALADSVTSLADQLTIYQAQVTNIAKSMQDAGVLDPNKAAAFTKLNTEIDKVKAQVVTTAAAIKAGTYNSDDATIITILKAAQAANAATAPFNPYAGYISAALSLALILVGLFAKKKSTALNEVVMGDELFKATATPDAIAAFKKAQTITQSESTTKEVRTITA